MAAGTSKNIVDAEFTTHTHTAASASPSSDAAPATPPALEDPYPPFSIYLQNRICDLVMEGVKLNEMHEHDADIPTGGRIVRELSMNRAFKVAFEQAKEVYAHALMEETVQIADDGRNDTYQGRHGLQTNFDNIKRSELRVRVRKELAEKYNVPFYGKVDRSEINVNRTLSINGMTPQEIAAKLEEIRQRAIERKEAQERTARDATLTSKPIHTPSAVTPVPPPPAQAPPGGKSEARISPPASSTVDERVKAARREVEELTASRPLPTPAAERARLMEDLIG